MPWHKKHNKNTSDGKSIFQSQFNEGVINEVHESINRMNEIKEKLEDLKKLKYFINEEKRSQLEKEIEKLVNDLAGSEKFFCEYMDYVRSLSEWNGLSSEEKRLKTRALKVKVRCKFYFIDVIIGSLTFFYMGWGIGILWLITHVCIRKFFPKFLYVGISLARAIATFNLFILSILLLIYTIYVINTLANAHSIVINLSDVINSSWFTVSVSFLLAGVILLYYRFTGGAFFDAAPVPSERLLKELDRFRKERGRVRMERDC